MGINATLFKPALSNNAYLRMDILDISERNELQYIININNWPWSNNANMIQFCFHIFIPNGNDLQFKCSNNGQIATNIGITKDNLNICHRFKNNLDLTEIAHIFYSPPVYISPTMDNKTTFNLNQNNNKQPNNRWNREWHEQIAWLFGVFIAIGFIVCIFLGLILYLVKDGFFDDGHRKTRKRNNKTTVIIDKRISTNNHKMPSTPTSPKKNIRINVTSHHSPICSGSKGSTQTTKTTEAECSKTNSCDTVVRMIHPLIEGNEEEEQQEKEQEPTVIRRGTTPVISTRHSINDTEFEESMIQYIITCQNDNKDTSPVPFV